MQRNAITCTKYAAVLALALATTMPMMAASASVLNVNFDVHDPATPTILEHFSAAVTFGSALITDVDGFTGYRVTAISGTQAGNPLSLPSLGSVDSPFGQTSNLFNPDPATGYFGRLGLGYADGPTPATDYYTIYSVGGQLLGCWCFHIPIDILIVTNFSVVPEPASMTILGMGLLGLGALRRRARA